MYKTHLLLNSLVLNIQPSLLAIDSSSVEFGNFMDILSFCDIIILQVPSVTMGHLLQNLQVTGTHIFVNHQRFRSNRGPQLLWG